MIRVMPPANPESQVDEPGRSQLRIADLKRRIPATTRLMNVKMPVHLLGAIARLATKLGTSKTDVVVALLNAGLDRAEAKFKDRR